MAGDEQVLHDAVSHPVEDIDQKLMDICGGVNAGQASVVAAQFCRAGLIAIAGDHAERRLAVLALFLQQMLGDTERPKEVAGILCAVAMSIDPERYRLQEAFDAPTRDALKNLMHHQEQLDADGVMVSVSREALERVLTLCAHIVVLYETKRL